MPVDLLPSSNGNLSINEGKDGVLEAVVLTLGQAAGMRAAGLPTFTSHFVGCPGADTFRRRALTKNSRRIR